MYVALRGGGGGTCKGSRMMTRIIACTLLNRIPVGTRPGLSKGRRRHAHVHKHRYSARQWKADAIIKKDDSPADLQRSPLISIPPPPASQPLDSRVTSYVFLFLYHRLLSPSATLRVKVLLFNKRQKLITLPAFPDERWV